MTVPPRIRVNVAAPFPSLVTGSGPISIGKQNGIWNVGLNIGALGTQVPAAANYATDYVIAWDSVSNTHFKMSLDALDTLPARTFATLPPAIAGAMAYITDATVNTWGTNITVGGGALKALLWFNGTNWTVMGK